MYSIAVAVAACLRGGTRVDVAWSLDPDVTPRFDPNDAVAITPGGGRLGGLLGGALDSRLVEIAAAKPTNGRVFEVELDAIEAEAMGCAPDTTLRLMIAPAETLPVGLWDHLVDRDPISVTAHLDGDIVSRTQLVEVSDPRAAVTFAEDSVQTVWSPRPTLLIMGGGPMAESVAAAGRFIGWNVEVMPGPDAAVGLASTLSHIDGVVVVGHDIEGTGRVLQAAVGGRAGYVGSLGPASVREARSDWLAYRGVSDQDSISSPAGLDIGAKAPKEVAIAVIAEMIAAHNTAEG